MSTHFGPLQKSRIFLPLFSLPILLTLLASRIHAAAADPSQCMNGGSKQDGTLEPLKSCTGTNYASGNASKSKAHWLEGEFISYRAVLTGLTAGPSRLRIAFDVTHGGAHAVDYIGSFDATETTSATPSLVHKNGNNPCGDVIVGCNPAVPDGVSNDIPPANFVIPASCGASGTFTGTQVAGKIKIWGGTAPVVSYVTQNSASGGDCETTVDINFNATGTTAVIAWGGHIASQFNWGNGNSASAISGSPYHAHLIEMATNGVISNLGRKDLPLDADSVIQTLSVNKACVPANDTGKFNLQVNGVNYLNSIVNGGDASCGGTTGMIPVVPDNHTASESGGAGTIFDNYSKRVTCVDIAGTVLVNNVAATSTSVPVNRGDQVTCTFTNTLLTGQLTVRKNVDPSNDPGKFNLFIKDANQVVKGSASNIGHNGSTGAITLLQATYTVGETAGTSTLLTDYTSSIDCKDQGGNGQTVASAPNAGPLAVTLGGSGNIVCTITNQRNQGKLEVRKSLSPANDAGKFDLFIDATTYTGPSNGGFGNGGTTQEQLVNTGTHQVGESQHTGTLLSNYTSSISCRDNNGSGSEVAATSGPGPLNVNVSMNADIVCVVTNTRKAQLKIVKAIVPATDSGKFNLFIKQNGTTVANGSVSNIGHNGSVGFLTLSAGTYSVSETQGTPNDGMANYSTSINCDKAGYTPVNNINAEIDGILPDPALVSEPSANITLADGDVITCTITNTRKARMPLTKTVNGQANAAQFRLSLYPDLGGAHVSAATFPSSASTPLASITGPAFPSITVLGGPFVVCEMGTFDGASTSDGFPSGSAATWTVNGVLITAGGVSVPPGGTATGNLTVAVFDPEVAIGQPSKNRTCISGIELKAGGIISIALNNVPPGQIVVRKITVPAGDTVTSFPFTADYNANGFSLKHGQSNASPFLAPGTYNISETATAGYELTAVNCELTKTGLGTSQFSNTLVVSQPTSVTLASGDEVTCTFTNTKQAKISVEKLCTPSGAGSFEFTKTDGGTPATINLTCGQKQTFVGPTVATGTWTITESSKPANWDLTNIQCTADAGLQYISNGAVITMNPGDDINCQFTNTQRGSLTIVKDAIYGASSVQGQDFTFEPSNLSGSTFMLDDDGDATLPASKDFLNLPANNTTAYAVMESPLPSGWGLTNITCVDTDANDGDGNLTVQSTVSFDGTEVRSIFQGGKNRVNVRIAPGEHLTCTFVNTELGKIIVAKQTLPAGDPAQFTFTTGDVPGFPTSQQTPDNKLGHGESFTVINIFPGSYHITESLAADWDLHSSSTCSDGDSTFNIGSRQATYQIAVGETVTCTFVNEKRGHIIVDKVTIPSGVLDVFHFDATGGSSPAYRDFSLRDQDPPNDQALRPGTYTVAELANAGFDLHNIHCELIVRGEGTSTFPVLDSTNQPVVIDLKSGDTVMCTFTNKRKPMLVLNKIARFGDDRFPYDLTDRGTLPGTEDDSKSTVSVRTAKPYYDAEGKRIGTQGQEIFYLTPGHTYDLLENLTALPDWYMNNVSCTFEGSSLAGDPNPPLTVYPLHPVIYNDLLNPPGQRVRDIAPVRLHDILDAQNDALEYLDVVTCTFTNTQEAIMPLNKLINGCQPNANENSGKCGAYPAFTFNLYLQAPVPVADPLDATASHIVPLPMPTPQNMFPVFPAGYLATVTAPPRIELPGPTGIPFSVCEVGVPEGWENLNWTVEITMYGSNKPDQVITYLPYDPTQVRPDVYNPDYFLFGVQGANSGNRCINVTIPLGADRFEIFVNNVTGRGRMTGGGSAFTTTNESSTRVTHGFELHCNANDDPNRLQINWEGNRFHLESMSSAKCSTDRRIEGTNRPAAGFNTYEGTGTGRLNGESGYRAAWVFTDAGEPGTGDTMALRIINAAGTTVLTVGSINLNGNGGIVNSAGVALTFGNHQAHK